MPQKHKEKPLIAIILAAGRGTRMGGDIPKVCRELNGKPLVAHVLNAVEALSPGRILAVVGHGAQIVKTAISAHSTYPVEFVEQVEQLGTGHAVLSTEPSLYGFEGDILVRYGDVPFISIATLKILLGEHRRRRPVATLLSVDIDNSTGYGRILRAGDGRVLKIVEDRNATSDEKSIYEINVGAYCFDAGQLFSALRLMQPNNVNGEYYLTEAVSILADSGSTVRAVKAKNTKEVHGVNTAEQLQFAESLIKKIENDRNIYTTPK